MDKEASGKGRASEGRARKKGASPLEWIAAGIGALVLLAMLGLIGVQALRPAEKEPPRLEVRPGALVSARGQHVVTVEVVNDSPQAAGSVEIEGVLKRGEEELETSSASLAFVPGHSKRSAGLIFTKDPRTLTLEVRATGYEEP